jgi:hypothetical protein
MPWHLIPSTKMDPAPGLVTEVIGDAYRLRLRLALHPSPDEATGIAARARALSTDGLLDGVRRRIVDHPVLARYRAVRNELTETEVSIRRLDREAGKLEADKSSPGYYQQPDIGPRLAACNARLGEIAAERQRLSAAADALRVALGESRNRAEADIASLTRGELHRINARLQEYREALLQNAPNLTAAELFSEMAAVHEAQLMAGRTDGLVADAKGILDEPPSASATTPAPPTAAA